ncbi:hypothetical protein CLU79DRAFT_730933 [Phycomyces nitens]|nr:hypothetical protein CLU79DRAFT_730933 [Phycomyces nitens]
MEQSTETCPLCTEKRKHSSLYDTWLQCDACSTWYHAECLGLSLDECNTIERYHCSGCSNVHGPTTYKQKPRKTSRNHARLNYADLNEGKTGDEKIWGKILRAKSFANDPFKRYKGDEVTVDLARKTGMTQPFVIEKVDFLDMQMPASNITVNDIAKAVGEDQPVEVIDVGTQSEQPGWTVGRWAAYYHSPTRDRIRNVISLEISNTEFARGITRPKFVRDMDWIDNMWPSELKPKEYPKVQLYCLMGTKDSYTDFHIDFGGTSVFYHIISGSKVFYFIEPTPKNLKKYQKWSSSPDQSSTFLGDQVKECYAVHLKAGNTMIIPTGWIHAVYTPEDAIVIGGNFLHGINISTQLRIYDIEDATNVPQKFRFPFYKRINWYAAYNYNKILQDSPGEMSPFELQGIASLAQFLQHDLNKLQKSSGATTEQRRAIRADIPALVSDGPGLISDLIKGVENALRLLTLQTAAISKDSKVLKVKLKVKPSSELPLPTSRDTKERKPKKSAKHQKIVLKVKSKKRKADQDDEKVVESDEEYVDNEPEFFEDLKEEGDLESEDEEYEEEEEDYKESPRKRKQTSPSARKSRKKPVPKREVESSSEDELGTKQTIKASRSDSAMNRGGLGSQSKKPQTLTVKQRLLERIDRAKR